MSSIKIKVVAFLVALLFLVFFSNDFGLIDIEKTAIITAVAIDYSNEGQYELTAQVAVPEATDSNPENLKAHVTGKGGTMGAAFKDLGDVSGWYPNLNFCNLIVLGEDFKDKNVIEVLDYFGRTLRVQDSALVVYSEGKAKDILNVSSPLDNISSFAIQKILFKNPGFDMEVAKMDIKNFTVGYYSRGGSSFMPVIKTMSEDGDISSGGQGSSNSSQGASNGSQEMSGGNSGSSGSSSQSSSSGSSSGGGNSSNQKKYFNAKTTALFKNGIKVGELDQSLTTAYNIITTTFEGSTIEIKDVNYKGENKNFLLTVFRNSPKISLTADQNNVNLNVNLDVFCRISDQNTDYAENTLVTNKPLPKEVKEKAERKLSADINNLIEVSKVTGCDFLNLTDKLYRCCYKHYFTHKDTFLSTMKVNVSVTVQGQK